MAITLALPAPAQMRNINLTGAPIKAITEPFSVIAGVREIPGNKVVVADSRERTLSVANFTTGGANTVGRNGTGPGEFQTPTAVLPASGNDTWIVDPGNSKVHLLTPEGKIPSSITGPNDEAAPIFNPRAIDGLGRFYLESIFRGAPGTAGASMDSLSILRWDPKAKKLDTLGRVPSGMSVNTSGSSGGNMRVMVTSKPYASAPVWAPLPDGRLVIVQPSPYRVDILGVNKVLTRGPVQAFTPIKVTAAERNAERERRKRPTGVGFSRTVGSSGGGTSVTTSAAPAAAQSEIPDEDFPAVLPPFTGRGSVLISPQGEIWVLRTRPASDKVPTYDIFNSAGQLTGKATLKPNSTVVGFGAGVVYVARQDPEDDLRYLEKYAR